MFIPVRAIEADVHASEIQSRCAGWRLARSLGQARMIPAVLKTRIRVPTVLEEPARQRCITSRARLRSARQRRAGSHSGSVRKQRSVPTMRQRVSEQAESRAFLAFG